MQYQIDFGNLAVGIGTALVAVAAFLSNRNSSRVRVSEYRKEWNDHLRARIADFCYLMHQIEDDDLVSDDTPIRSVIVGSKSDAIISDLMKTKYEIDLMLNAEEKDHKSFLSYMDDMLEFRKTTSVGGLIEIGRVVLKSEWNRVKLGK